MLCSAIMLLCCLPACVYTHNYTYMIMLSAAGVAFDMGLVSEATQSEISERTEEVVQLISQNSWEAVSRGCFGGPGCCDSGHYHCRAESAAQVQWYGYP